MEPGLTFAFYLEIQLDRDSPSTFLRGPLGSWIRFYLLVGRAYVVSHIIETFFRFLRFQDIALLTDQHSTNGACMCRITGEFRDLYLVSKRC